MSVFIFFAVLFLLVLVHELGHFVMAKWTGMRVDEFGIGFPPKLFGVRKGETLYTFNAVPIGGFVKILGEDGDSEMSHDNSDRARTFTAKSKWAQTAVLLAGVTMNVLFAWLLFSMAFAVGVQTAVNEGEAGDSAKLVVTEVLSSGPADLAMIPRGAVIHDIHADHTSIPALTPTEFVTFVEAHAQTPITIAYEFSGELKVAELQPRVGVIANMPERPAVGIALTLVETVSRPVHIALRDGFLFTLTSVRDITLGIAGLLADAVRFKADFSQVAGPVGIVGLVGEASAFGFTSLIMFTAFISLNLAVINVLPFPALDGGRLLFVIIEAIKGSPIPARYAHSLNMIGFALLILLMVAVTWNDVSKLI